MAEQPRTALLIISANPALDRTMIFENLRLGSVQRTSDVIVAAGGKGLNVARAAGTLGLPGLVVAPLGGYTGAQIADLAAEEGIAGAWYRHSAGESRTCVLLVDRNGGDATALNEAGPALSAGDWEMFADHVVTHAQQAQLGVVAGSLPSGVAPTDLATLLQRVAGSGMPTIVDTSGPALAAAIAAQPFGIKVNQHELGAVLGRTIETPAEAYAAVNAVRAQGIALVVVSLGAQGALAADSSGCWHAAPPPLQIVSSIGSGDSLLAGLCSGLLRSASLAEALALGVACGSADALTIGGGNIDPITVEQLRAAVRITPIAA